MRSSGGVLHLIFQIRIHPQFTAQTRANDISTIQTVLPIVFNWHTQSIALPTNVHGVANGVVSGWGKLFHNQLPSAAPELLQFLSAATLFTNDCRQMHFTSGRAGLILESNICAFSRAGQGMCGGDNGGPLVVGREIVGIASFGVACAAGVPDIFTRVSWYLQWIRQNSN